MKEKIRKQIELANILKARRTPISKQALAHELDCHERSVGRYIAYLRDELHCPIEKNELGFFLDQNSGDYELPGVWLTNTEAIGLATISKALDDMGLSTADNPSFNAIKTAINGFLEQHDISSDNFYKVIKILPSHKQTYKNLYFTRASEAILNKKRLTVDYSDFNGNITNREISPLQLVHYRENWFIDAYCHLRKDLRQFKLYRVSKAVISQKQAKQISEKEHLAYYASAYGIFAGEADKLAKLRFTKDAAREVAQQQWHPKQLGEWQGEDYLLSFPYKHDHELIQDVLSYANNVEVLSPKSLRNKVQRVIKGMASIYVG